MNGAGAFGGGQWGGIVPRRGWMYDEPTQRKTSEEFMFGSDPIVGYRLWSVGKQDFDSLPDFLGLLADAHEAGADNPYRWALAKTQQTLLRPIAAQGGGAWLPGVTEARCTKASHKAPNLQCECGFWALRNEEQLVAAFDAYQPMAWGTVKLWGRFCEFEKGYRAQYAYPEKITLLNGDDRLAYELASAYGCEVGVGDVPEAVTVARAAHAARVGAETPDWTSSYQAMLFDLKGKRSAQIPALLNNHLAATLRLSNIAPPKKKWWQR